MAMGDGVWGGLAQIERELAYRLEHSVDHGKRAGQHDIQVDKDNVLKIAKTVEDVLNEEGSKVTQLLMFIDKLQPPGGDTVSGEVAPAWSERLFTAHDSHANRIREYVDGLWKFVENLKNTAKKYGYNDAQIAQALDGTGK